MERSSTPTWTENPTLCSASTPTWMTAASARLGGGSLVKSTLMRIALMWSAFTAPLSPCERFLAGLT